MSPAPQLQSQSQPQSQPQPQQGGTLSDLGDLVKKKYPQYSSVDSAELGRRVQSRYPDAYSMFSDGPSGAASGGGSPTPSPSPSPPPVMNIPGPGAGSPSASGFGTPITQLAPPPPIVDQGLFMPSEARRRANETFDTQQKNQQAIALAEAQRRAQTGQLEDVEAFKRRQRQQTLSDLEAQGVELTPRMKAEILSGQNIQPELKPQMIPGYVQGKTILTTNPNATDAFGGPIDPNEFHRVRKAADGTMEYFPEVGGTTKRVVIHSDGKSFLETYDRTGTKIGEQPVINPLMLPQVTTVNGVSMQQMQIEDPDTHRLMLVQVPTPHGASTVTQRQAPGPAVPVAAPNGVAPAAPQSAPRTLLPPPGAPPPAAGAGRVTGSNGLPGGSRVIGAPAAQQRMDVQQPLSPVAQSIVLKTQPQIVTLTRLQKVLEPYKNDSTPLTTFLPRLAYSMGFASSDPKKNVDDMLSNLEMTSITSAASALAGTTRARAMLEKSMLHTTNAWKDSGKLMYDKVGQIRQRLQDIVDEAKGPEGQKNPGLAPPPAMGGSTGGGRPPLSDFHK